MKEGDFRAFGKALTQAHARMPTVQRSGPAIVNLGVVKIVLRIWRRPAAVGAAMSSFVA